MAANFNQILVGFIAVFLSGTTESTVFFRKDGLPSSVFSSGVKDYPFPVKLVRVTNTVAVPVPYPVHVTRKVPYPITVTRPIPYAVPHPVPVQITKPVVIRQPVPIPVVKPVVIPQPVFHPNHHFAAHQAYNNNYMNYLKNQAYNPGFPQHYAPIGPFMNNNSQPNQEPEDGGVDHVQENGNFGNEEPGNFGAVTGFDVPSRTILPPSVSSEYGSNEFGSIEADSLDDGTSSHEIYRKQVVPVANSEENQGSSSQQEDDINASSAQKK